MKTAAFKKIVEIIGKVLDLLQLTDLINKVITSWSSIQWVEWGIAIAVAVPLIVIVVWAYDRAFKSKFLR